MQNNQLDLTVILAEKKCKKCPIIRDIYKISEEKLSKMLFPEKFRAGVYVSGMRKACRMGAACKLI